MCVCVLVAQSCLTLCDLMNCSPPGSSVHGILQARIQEWVAMPPSRGSSQPRDRTYVSYACPLWQASSLPLVPLGKSLFRLEVKVSVLVALLCPTLCDPMDCSLPGSSVHGILQARILEWVAMPSSRASSQPRDQTQVSHIAGRFSTIWATRKAQTK